MSAIANHIDAILIGLGLLLLVALVHAALQYGRPDDDRFGPHPD